VTPTARIGYAFFHSASIQYTVAIVAILMVLAGVTNNEVATPRRKKKYLNRLSF
jgi:hypothetical protein